MMMGVRVVFMTMTELNNMQRAIHWTCFRRLHVMGTMMTKMMMML